ncbi:hypothetical protein Cpin_2366 [Sporocytophaga myxococcoides]|uniref:Polysaccharide pyruvyl transferase domain-containing protein n=1 Tax=Sporocytophaga myxococcoides TaxID=153721 RepID=A0A098LAV3_9BACT|nr:polysaccharide pyruvyl transferase family protein [Sporocytophaga myxococcoides]GAL84055.1 hypothetical protein Cpin_2366 [Sporocytophaga myxococcoides]
MKYYYQVEGHLRNNIGDVLQGMVAKRFLPGNPSVVDREALSTIPKTEPGLLIANGWYMHTYDRFPAPDNIIPIYTSVHIADSKLLLDPKVREHFKKNAPIGCRDSKTLQLMLGWGIPAYYSSCLTTTCERRATAAEGKRGEVLLVDNVDHPVPENVKNKLEQMLGKTMVRISHDPPNTEGDIETYARTAEDQMDLLLKRYCNAELVITTKIHCALPCLGMGANVMFIHPNPSDPRLATLAEFTDIISYNDILQMNQIQKPEVRQDRLEKRKKFLSDFVKSSIALKENPIKNANNFAYGYIKYKSYAMANVYRAGVMILGKLGIAKEKISRVYGIQ